MLTFLMMSSIRPLWADEVGEIDIALPAIPENLASDKVSLGGIHGILLKEALSRIDMPISYRISSPNQAYAGFFDKIYTCVTPDSRDYYPPGQNYIDSVALRETTWVIVQRRDTPEIEDKSGLVGKMVGSMYPADGLYNVVPQEGVTYDVNADVEDTVNKVAKGRLDAAVLPKAILPEVLQNEDYSNLTFEKSQPLAKVGDAVMCHDTERGREIIRQINAVLK